MAAAWSVTIIPTILILLALWGPGVLVLSAARIRGFALLAFAPLISLLLITTLPIIGQWWSIRWGWAFLLSATVLIAGVLLGCRRWIPRTRPLSAPIWPSLVGVFSAFPLAAGPMALAIRDPRMPPQTWDAVMHVNAVRRIVDTGDGSSITLGAVATVKGTPKFYPGGFHDLAALGVNGDVVVATNVTAIVLACIVWPLAVAALLAVVKPRSYLLHVSGAFAAIVFTALPSRPASYGTLWPIMAAYVLIPLVLAAFARALRYRDEGGMNALLMLLVAGAGVIGLSVIHPSAFFVIGLLSLPLILGALFYHYQGACKLDRIQQIGAWLAVTVLVGGMMAVWRSATLSAMEGWRRQPFGTLRREVLGVIADSQLATQGYGDAVIEWGLAIVTLVGLIVAARHRSLRWFVPSWLVACYLAVLAAVVDLPGYDLLAPWYYDPVRLGAIVPILAAPLAALGLQCLARGLNWLIGQLRAPWWVSQPVASVLVVVIFFGFGASYFSAAQRYLQIHINYHFRDESGLNAMISPEELEMQHRLADELPDNAKIVGDPRTGAALIYATAGIETYFPHLQGTWGAEGAKVGEKFDTLISDGEICEILRREGIEYFYTDELLYWPDNPIKGQYVGLVKTREILDQFTLIDSGGGAAVYRIDPCISD